MPGFAEEEPPVVLPVPREIMDPPWLEQRRQAQLATVGEFAARIDFQFRDRLEESEITFRNRVVEDAGITYKAVHYDHGNGIAVADVDLDGRYDIYFVNQVGANELWRNLGNGRLEDITESAGVGMSDRISVTASFADLDNDGDPDLYVTSVRAGNQLFENLGNGRFRDVTGDSGLGYRGHSSGAVLFDFDLDGLVDVYLANVGEYTSELPRIGNHNGLEYKFYDGHADAFGGHRFPRRTEKSLLFKNRGGLRFEDVTDRMRPPDEGWSGDATFLDFNSDGWPDLYTLNMQGNDQYYENQQGKAFVRKSRDVFPKTSWGAMGIKVFDWNNDSRMDIYVTDMHSDMSKDEPPGREHLKSDMQWNEAHLSTGGASIFGNTFFEQQADGVFKEKSDQIGVENYWPWGLSAGDLNADGYQDLFVTLGMNYPFRYQSNTLLINDQAERFRPAEFILGAAPRKDRRTSQFWFKLDCGGNHKLSMPQCKGQTGPLEVWSAKGSRASVIIDLDADGDLDIVTNEFNGEPMVLVSDLAQRGNVNYISVTLRGKQSNRSGIGARVSLTAGGRTQTQLMDGKSGYLSQSLLPLYFGLADNSTVERIEVIWPSGQTQVLTNPEANRSIQITEPGK